MLAYDQRHIRSMDAAITFHVGLSQRMLSNRRPPDGQPAVLDALATVRRRLEQTGDALIRARLFSEVPVARAWPACCGAIGAASTARPGP